jgi:hypothetical protein
VSKEIKKGARYTPVDERINSGMTAEVISTNQKNNTVTFWCGGRKYNWNIDEFLSEYQPKETWL